MKRIAAKVKEIQNLTIDEKVNQLHSSIDKRIMAKDYKERVADLSPPRPGSAAHVLSLEDYLREVNRQFDDQELRREVQQSRSSSIRRSPQQGQNRGRIQVNIVGRNRSVRFIFPQRSSVSISSRRVNRHHASSALPFGEP